MFTGIIETTGKVQQLEATGGDWRLEIVADGFDFSDVALGDSIAVSGVCLTVIRFSERSFCADVSNETMACTSLGALKRGALVNLEKAMTPSSRLGGHIVSGHVDGLATLLSKTPDGRSERLIYRVPKELSRYIAAKGSVCLDGVSLTVNSIDNDEFSVNIIPHTAERTTLHEYQPGRQVNLEVDVVSRYLERLLQVDKGTESGITLESLTKAGF